MMMEQTNSHSSAAPNDPIPPPLIAAKSGRHSPAKHSRKHKIAHSPHTPSTQEQHDRDSLGEVDSKEGILQSDSKRNINRKPFSQYSPAQQSRIRKDLHKKLMKLAGGDENEAQNMLQSYFNSNIDGKRIFTMLELPQTRNSKFERLIPVFRSEMESDLNKKKIFLSLFRKASFAKTDVEETLTITCTNELWNSAIQEEGDELEGRASKKRKTEEGESATTSSITEIASSSATSEENALSLNEALPPLPPPPLNQLAEEASKPLAEENPVLVQDDQPKQISETS